MPDPRHNGERLAGCYIVPFEVDAMKCRVMLGVSVVVVSLAVVSAAQTQAQDSPRPVVGRSMVVTGHGIVAASQPLAARAGVQVLERGGNAIDAAIAANSTIGLMEPTGNGIGGDLFALIYIAETGELHGLNASGWAPSGRTVEFLRSKGFDEVPSRGIYSVTVPGVSRWVDAQPDAEAKRQAAEAGAAQAQQFTPRNGMIPMLVPVRVHNRPSCSIL